MLHWQHMNDLKTCTSTNSDECAYGNCRKGFKVMDNSLENMSAAKGEGNLCKFFYSLPLKCSQYIIKETMRTKFSKEETASHAILALINCKQSGDDSLTSFTYWWEKLLLQSNGISAEQCRDILNTDLFLSQLLHEKITRRDIQKYAQTVAHAFQIVTE